MPQGPKCHSQPRCSLQILVSGGGSWRFMQSASFPFMQKTSRLLTPVPHSVLHMLHSPVYQAVGMPSTYTSSSCSMPKRSASRACRCPRLTRRAPRRGPSVLLTLAARRGSWCTAPAAPAARTMADTRRQQHSGQQDLRPGCSVVCVAANERLEADAACGCNCLCSSGSSDCGRRSCSLRESSPSSLGLDSVRDVSSAATPSSKQTCVAASGGGAECTPCCSRLEEGGEGTS
mmetsp:Transcript_53364/g.170980  ORF Transcript_53364/g.170980 Transcript_53364/m.170980 type:complete len:232 (+) Transcript_53364:1509-2204(+)